MKTSDIVFDVVDFVLLRYSLFPTRCAFHRLAEAVIARADDTLSKFKECSRDSISLLPGNLGGVFRSQKSAAKGMQLTRTALNVFNILDLTALKYGINSSTCVTNEKRAKDRSLLYDGNANSLRSLYGTLPLWMKTFPSLTIIYMRCAVKVAQKRYAMATAGLIGDDVLELFTNYAEGETTHELERLCDKLQKYLYSLRSFIEDNCTVETELSANEVDTRTMFSEAARRCKSLVLAFNNCVPILHIVNGGMRSRIEEAWEIEGEDVEGSITERLVGYEKGLIFSEKEVGSSSSHGFEDVRFLREVATDKCSNMNRLGSDQVSILASSQIICSTIAQSGQMGLRNIGYVEDNIETAKKRRLGSGSEGKTGKARKVEYTRNNQYQMDIFCLWDSILHSDSFLDKNLLSDNTRTRSSVQIFISDEWYERLFSSLLVPCLVEEAFGVPNSEALRSASSCVLARYAEKANNRE